MTEIYGPQPKGDNKFAARMRFHQSWYRAEELKVPCGTGPQVHSQTKYGNMLDKDGAVKGLNFLNNKIFEAAKARADDKNGTVDEYRLFHNMLSSQPMCFNLFTPLDHNRELAKRVFSELVPTEIRTVNRVLIEYAPSPNTEYLNDRTAFDAFIEYTDADGNPGFVGVETKLTEPFSPQKHERDEYLKWTQLENSPWPRESWSKLPEVRINQLWRDHLLAIAMLQHGSSDHKSGYLMLVRHPLDEHCTETVGIYQGLLKPHDSTFIDCPLDKLVDLVVSLVGDGDERDWVNGFRRRYLDLSLSDDAWKIYQKGLSPHP